MRGVMADHYFSAEPSSSQQDRSVTFTAGGRAYELTAAAGVFSAGRLDPGTAVLLRKVPYPSGGTLLDLGCGYGPIASVLATEAPTATVYAVDVNVRARDLARRNTAELGVKVCAPDEVPDDVRFTEIWSNPPIRIGKDELHALLDRWLARLTDDGVAWLVVAKHLGGDSVHAWLEGRGWAVDRQASQKGYRVLRVTRPA